MEEEKKGAGRPSIDNFSIINELLAKPETRKQYKQTLRYLAAEKEKVMMLNDAYKEALKGAKESLGLSTGFLGKLVDALVKDDVKGKTSEAEAFADLLAVLGEDDKESDDEDQDEDFED